jgi:alpha-tubulin suppressor-like RCC1 family protein
VGQTAHDQLIVDSPVPDSDIALLPPFTSSRITKICCGAYHSLALTEEGTVFVWGDNLHGKCGFDESETPKISEPRELPLPSPARDVSCGYAHTLVLLRDGRLLAFGRNVNGELGLGHLEKVIGPHEIPEIKGVKLAIASYHNVAIDTEGNVWSWGWNGFGNVGNGSTTSVRSPIRLWEGREDIRAVAVGGAHTWVLRDDGGVEGWGCNDDGQLGLGHNESVNVPEEVPMVGYRGKVKREREEGEAEEEEEEEEEEEVKLRVAGIGCLDDHSYVVTTEGDLYVCGKGGGGRLGLAGEESKSKLTWVKGRKFWAPTSPEREWGKWFFWLFLGKLDTESPFWRLPVEVLYNFVVMNFGRQREY